MELVPAPGIRGVSGSVELGRIPGPFTVAVDAEGRSLYAPTITLAGLPSASSLGSYSTYVAWATTAPLDSVVNLGPVENGSTPLGRIGLDKFLILVTAEASPGGSAPEGKVVLRAQSPSMRLQPPDLLEFAIGGMTARASPEENPSVPESTAERMPSHAAGDHGRAAIASGNPDERARDGEPHLGGVVGGLRDEPPPLAWTGVPMPAGLRMLPAEMELRPAVSPYLPGGADGEAPAARSRQIVRLEDGDTLRLEAGPVRRDVGGRSAVLYGFNRQISGPLVEAPQGARAVVEFTNRLDQPTTVHWHGLRLDNPFDGVPGLTQDPVPPGGRFTYHVRFPDAGIFWYHPHVREDIQQDLGLYGNLLVRSAAPAYFGPANREEVLLLDDLLVGDAGLVPYGSEEPTHALMGRFGNLLLVNGEPDYRLEVRRGEVVRFFLTNASSTRTFNLSFAGARMKVVASDEGNFEREAWVESVVLAPAERYVVHVRFDEAGDVPLLNRVQGLDHLFGRFFAETDTLGVVRVKADSVEPDLGDSFSLLRADSVVAADIDAYRGDLDRPPDKSLVLTLETQGLPFVTERLLQLDSLYFAPVEWSGTMPMMNWASTAEQVRWILRDPATGRENMDVDWRFHVGDVVKLRILNERTSFHAMQHPIHVHGQRFLVLAVNGVPNDDLVWKDTALIPAGSVVDILLDLSNPGRWMLHCHIAEHLAAGMMAAFTVQ
jgi:FtsP/CotA-like multicopper oxidase with cupredoxin domain